ncbi:hypothetical protein J0X19_22070 [Hymenobacter sp. BT186]|uniref:Uncharacterized protein n=1 Tax=Hymenobacter telluris TaxID=2816474 RepID=A0A939F030_9BACT|nr:hypothetical protein [Hymenobacter telluris]MBO0360663.1 hypothetical protein [Hymenobacter telluris]MBW3376690.1 hypothetical protein [Hymenobacter norwichensis]
MDLRRHDQLVELHQDEANALCHSIRIYHQHLVWASSFRPLHLPEVMSIRPTQRVLERLTRLLAGPWPRTKDRRLKGRKWRLEMDELLQLNALFVADELTAPDALKYPLYSILGKVNKKAHNLTTHFQLY